MTGKLKTKGNMMLATKLDGVLKVGILFIVVVLIWLTLCSRQRRKPNSDASSLHRLFPPSHCIPSHVYIVHDLLLELYVGRAPG